MQCDIGTEEEKNLELRLRELEKTNTALDKELRERNLQLYKLREENQKLKEGSGFSFNSITLASKPESTLNFFTGVPKLAVFLWILNRIVPLVKHQTSRLTLADHLLIVLMKLKLGLFNRDIAYRFKVSDGCISKIFRSWLPVLAGQLKNLIIWPEKSIIRPI